MKTMQLCETMNKGLDWNKGLDTNLTVLKVMEGSQQSCLNQALLVCSNHVEPQTASVWHTLDNSGC